MAGLIFRAIALVISGLAVSVWVIAMALFGLAIIGILIFATIAGILGII
ncbi:hypothetical protein PP460_gp011 [Streptomyces phage Muntaha]|uniref:Uncharacterized protein n=1 Tax=Streptomyces phage Muntaha TaxID=2713269 RepID=A0A6G8R3P0_9CAUD|nr:hypothetical protein PP460_gp005 [Streptomyces phage Muntaha]YP_010652547.1 hypothetical protein PP460_gp011 [Streptomyces phage Muntaha]QIN94565.1 hypothetical protein SEA_MUNTAHA_5 [Streptomyces phage Muntaha]QIN94791.1 hypothetical protein SEA_MUNTAHA_268 [Streptomyces phage Muntaha]